jgi:hypothetical protein
MTRASSVTILLITLLGSGCGRGTVDLARLAPTDPAQGFKMLRPQATATECRLEAPWRPGGSSTDDLVDRALTALLRSDAEADAVVNTRLEWTSWTVGVYGRRCVTLTGDVVRSIRTVLLPMPGHDAGHEAHGAH